MKRNRIILSIFLIFLLILPLFASIKYITSKNTIANVKEINSKALIWTDPSGDVTWLNGTPATHDPVDITTVDENAAMSVINVTYVGTPASGPTSSLFYTYNVLIDKNYDNSSAEYRVLFLKMSGVTQSTIWKLPNLYWNGAAWVTSTYEDDNFAYIVGNSIIFNFSSCPEMIGSNWYRIEARYSFIDGYIDETGSTYFAGEAFPTLIVESPLNQTYTTNTIQVNLSSPDSDLDTMWYRIRNGSDWITSNLTWSEGAEHVLPDGPYTLFAWANDTKGYESLTTVAFGIDTVPPNVTIQSPGNQTYYEVPILINLTSDDSDLDTIWYRFFNVTLGDWLDTTNLTYTGVTERTSWDGQYILYAWANDTHGNVQNTAATIFFTVNASPTAKIDSPLYFLYTTNTIQINLSCNAPDLDMLWYQIHNGSIWIVNKTIWSPGAVEYLSDGVYTLFAWANDTSGMTQSIPSNVSFYISTPFGISMTFTNTTVISTNSVSSSYDPRVALDSNGNLHVVWGDMSNYSGCGDDMDIFYKYWNATTQNWSITEVLSIESTDISNDPSLTVDRFDNIHVVWEDRTNYSGCGTDYDIFYKAWNSSTEAWSNVTVLSTEGSSWSRRTDLVSDTGGNLHVVWDDPANIDGAGIDKDIFYRFWNKTSDKWSNISVISTESTGQSEAPSLDIDNKSFIYLTWEDSSNFTGCGTDDDIFYKVWNNTARSWSNTTVISTESTATSYDTQLKIDNLGNVHVAWTDYTNFLGCGTDRDIFYKVWNNSTQAWSDTKIVSADSSVTSIHPSLYADGRRNVHVVWSDGTNISGCGTDYDIFHKLWNSTIQARSITTVVSTESTSGSYYPHVVIDKSERIHVVWQDYTNFSNCGDDRDVFYKSGIINVISMPNTTSLDTIFPNPDSDGIIHLNWSNVGGATQYYVYRNDSTITTVVGLTPIAMVSMSNYTDTLFLNGTYYYVIVAGNAAGNSSISNCENVTVAIPTAIPNPPVLEPIFPNPSNDGIIALNWSDVVGATTYYVYRNTSTITSVAGLTAIATVSTSNYTDTILINGTYYYVIVAGNISGNSSISNCENVTVAIPSLNPPVLESILPNIDTVGFIELNWSDVMGAITYYIYRNTSFITSVIGLTPIATVITSNYTDRISINGTYYYVIVAGNILGNSSLSNCKNVTVAISSGDVPPGFDPFMIILIIIIIGAIAVSSIAIYTYRRKSKPEDYFPIPKKFKELSLNEKIRSIVAQNIPIEHFEKLDASDLMNLLESEIIVITDELSERVLNLPMSDDEKKEILLELVRLPPELQKILLDDLEKSIISDANNLE
ncbi:MAG: hypothetical protein HWN65_19485 [Candidatus Helarchaeota archaeon]|nr:hypothetical protein [Candidatus Helarchaeota archaeon]